MKKVLFLCTENSCRSQMAEAICNKFLGDKVKAFSAGIRPSSVNPMAIEVLKEIGIDISSARSKHVSEFEDQSFDLVVTVCGDARESCPVWPGQGKRVHFGLEDPAKASGSKEERLQTFRKVRERITHELLPFLKGQIGIKEG